MSARRTTTSNNHHLEILTRSLIHDGRFREAREVREECLKNSYNFWQWWYRLYLGERDWDAALKDRRPAAQDGQADRQLPGGPGLFEKGRYGPGAGGGGGVAARGPDAEKRQDAGAAPVGRRRVGSCAFRRPRRGPEAALQERRAQQEQLRPPLLGRRRLRHGAVGYRGLQAGGPWWPRRRSWRRLAHDPGSVRAALACRLLCERHGRLDEAERYAELAHRCWRRPTRRTSRPSSPGCVERPLHERHETR